MYLEQEIFLYQSVASFIETYECTSYIDDDIFLIRPSSLFMSSTTRVFFLGGKGYPPMSNLTTYGYPYTIDVCVVCSLHKFS